MNYDKRAYAAELAAAYKTPAEVVEINRRLHAVGMSLACLRARTGRA